MGGGVGLPEFMVDASGGAEGSIQLNICGGRSSLYNPNGIPLVTSPSLCFLYIQAVSLPFMTDAL